jgi:hypothetical protein
MGFPAEKELLYFYIRDKFPAATVHYSVRLGSIPEINIPGLDVARARALAMVSMPELDAIVISQGVVYLVEAKIWKVWDNLGKMLIYKHLLPQTAGWENVDMSKVIPLMVVARAPEAWAKCAASMGVSFQVYSTPRVQTLIEEGRI